MTWVKHWVQRPNRSYISRIHRYVAPANVAQPLVVIPARSISLAESLTTISTIRRGASHRAALRGHAKLPDLTVYRSLAQHRNQQAQVVPSAPPAPTTVPPPPAAQSASVPQGIVPTAPAASHATSVRTPPSSTAGATNAPVAAQTTTNSGTKFRVYQKGDKSGLPINSLPDPTADRLSLFINEPVLPRYTRPICASRCTREKLLRSLPSDRDLVDHLKIEAAYVPKTPELARQLKQQGKRFLAKWDMSNYTSTESRKILLNAVAQAMLVQPEEEKLRVLAHSYQERVVVRPLHNQFFSLGRTGIADSTALSRTPKRVSALRTFFQRRLIPGIVF